MIARSIAQLNGGSPANVGYLLFILNTIACLFGLVLFLLAEKGMKDLDKRSKRRSKQKALFFKNDFNDIYYYDIMPLIFR